MADLNEKTILFPFSEIVTCLIKKEGIHEGIWQLYIEFGIGGANVGPSPDEIFPAAVVPISKIGLLRVEKKESRLAVDAAEVNPASKS